MSNEKQIFIKIFQTCADNTQKDIYTIVISPWNYEQKGKRGG